MTLKSIREYAEAVRRRYLKASKKEKKLILDEFCQTTGYHRKAAIRLLRHPPPATSSRHGRRSKYRLPLVEVLRRLWEVSDQICSKRLVPFLGEPAAVLERQGEMRLEPQVRQQLVSISPSTVDRLLKPYRSRGLRKPYSQTWSSSALKARVPIRTFGDWEDLTPGSLQVDLVMHCGESAEGFYLTTLVAVDVATGWTECEAIWGKGQERVGAGVWHVRKRLPFMMNEIHSDNGGEFLNHILYNWCKRNNIRYTRGRPYKKNDQAHAEQKNWSAVRRVVGYDRYAKKAAYQQLHRLYGLLNLYVNFFQPIRKLVGKEGMGAKVRKCYDVAQTPYQRLLATGMLGEAERRDLDQEYRSLNPVKLRAEIDSELQALWSLAEYPKKTVSKRAKEATACG